MSAPQRASGRRGTDGTMLHRLLVAASVCLIAAVAAVPTPAAPTIDDGRTAAAVGRSWIAAVNRGDLADAVALVAPEAVFDIGGAMATPPSTWSGCLSTASPQVGSRK
jgi:hypothetical protein